jgi:hypothetical protein
LKRETRKRRESQICPQPCLPELEPCTVSE